MAVVAEEHRRSPLAPIGTTDPVIVLQAGRCGLDSDRGQQKAIEVTTRPPKCWMS